VVQQMGEIICSQRITDGSSATVDSSVTTPRVIHDPDMAPTTEPSPTHRIQPKDSRGDNQAVDQRQDGVTGQEQLSLTVKTLTWLHS
ncbi:hypothetical protein LSAT2_026076, partial [Lamellibrachia satsuma]